MEKITKVSRQEIKYLINDVEASLLKASLCGTLLEDPYNKEDGYIVRSLYFDSYANTDFYEKMDGLENRKKIRLRVYSPEDSSAKLEIKRKYGNNQVKSSVTITKDDAMELIKQNYDILDRYTSNAATTIKNIMKVNHLVPVVMIEYNRTAFYHVMNNIRITFDSNIRSSECQFDLFRSDLVLSPVEGIQTTIVEVKYDGFLLHWVNQLISRYRLSKISFSKYTTSRVLFERYLS